MEDLEQSSLEEKVDLGNFVLFPPNSYVNKGTGEANFRIKDEPSEMKINDDIFENNNIKKEMIEVPVNEYEKETIEFSTNDNETSQNEDEEEISSNIETPTPALQHYSALKTNLTEKATVKHNIKAEDTMHTSEKRF
jgi:hypothetical protein